MCVCVCVGGGGGGGGERERERESNGHYIKAYTFTDMYIALTQCLANSASYIHVHV